MVHAGQATTIIYPKTNIFAEFLIFSTLQSYEFSFPGSSFEGLSQVSLENQGWSSISCSAVNMPLGTPSFPNSSVKAVSGRETCLFSLEYWLQSPCAPAAGTGPGSQRVPQPRGDAGPRLQAQLGCRSVHPGLAGGKHLAWGLRRAACHGATGGRQGALQVRNALGLESRRRGGGRDAPHSSLWSNWK